MNSARIRLGARFELKATLAGGEYFEKLKYFKIYFNHNYIPLCNESMSLEGGNHDAEHTRASQCGHGYHNISTKHK